MIFEALNKISFNRGSQIGLIIFGAILSPFMFLFQFFRNIIEENDFIHLTFICISVGLPIILILTGLRILDNSVLEPKEKMELISFRFSQIGSSSAMTGILFYLPCTYKYFDPSLSSRQAIIFLIVVYTGFIVSSIFSILNGSTRKMVDALEKLNKKK